MQSKIAERLQFDHAPVAIIFTDYKPDKCRQFQKGKWGCVMFMLAAAARGETAIFDKETFGCQGGGTGLGFGNQYKNFAGGEECFKYFLSYGNEKWQRGREVGEQIKEFMRPEAHHHFMHGERYLQSPEKVELFMESLPITRISTEFVAFTPLHEIEEKSDSLQVVVFLGNMDQISALTVLANYGRGHNENVIYPFAAGCQSIGIYPFRENNHREPRAVLGLNDISARLYLKRILKKDLMSFAVPKQLYYEMEANIEGSFLEQETWKQLQELKSDNEK